MPTLKQSLEEAQTRVTELESALETVTQQKVDADAKISELTDLTVARGADITEKDSAIVEKDSKIFSLEGEKAQLAKDLQASQTEATELKGSAKSSDERAREIAARNGANLPAKDKNAGNSLIGDQGSKTMSRSDFRALKAGERMAFIKAGGRLTNDE